MSQEQKRLTCCASDGSTMRAAGRHLQGVQRSLQAAHAVVTAACGSRQQKWANFICCTSAIHHRLICLTVSRVWQGSGNVRKGHRRCVHAQALRCWQTALSASSPIDTLSAISLPPKIADAERLWGEQSRRSVSRTH